MRPLVAQPVLLRAGELHTRDPEAFRAAAGASEKPRLALRAGGVFEGQRRRAEPGGVVVVRSAVSLDAVFHNGVGGEAIFTLPEGPVPGARLQGTPLPEATLAWWRPGAEIHTAWPAGHPWWNIALPAARLQAAASSLLGAPLRPPVGSVLLAPLTPSRHRALLHAARAAVEAPGWVPAGRLADAVLGALVVALDPARPAAREIPPTRERRAEVAGRLVALSEAPEPPRSLLEACAAAAVPLRTLNACANEVLGMSAAAYLRARRLLRVRALLATGRCSVTEAATAEGFWELGRFSRTYHAQFGERPSETLARAKR